MSKRNCSEDESDKEEDEEDLWASSSIPLPIQTFLWRQTSPFIRPKLSRLQDAAAMEQREACKLFEKVLVQNIQFGLSPSLTEAIHSVSRWRLIVAALPHVMHCCAALLYARRRSSFDKLSASETKLLYTLHWILLDAAEECADAENEQGIHHKPEHFLLPITTIQTFVYLFAPLIPHLKQSDFLTSFRLENGYKIWIPLFNFCHPEIPSFIAYAKKNSVSLSRLEKKIEVPKFGDVFIGASDAERDRRPSNEISDASGRKFASSNLVFPSDSPIHELLSKEELSKKFEFSEKDLADPSQATYLDVAVLRCLFTSQWIEDGIDWALSFIHHRLERIVKTKERRQYQRCRSSSLPVPKRREKEPEKFECKAKRSKNDNKNNQNGLDGQGSAQLKTLFQDQRRSSFSGLPGLSGFQALINSTSSASFGRHGSEKVKHKKHKKHVNDMDAIKNEPKTKNDTQIKEATKQHSYSFKTHSKSGRVKSNKKEKTYHENQPIEEVTDSNQEQPRAKSAMEFMYNFKDRKVSLSEMKLIEKNDPKGKSMPSLHLIGRKASSMEDSSHRDLSVCFLPEIIKSPSKTSLVEASHTVPFPIITITEHSPVASMQFFNAESGDSRRSHERTSKYKFYMEEDESEEQTCLPGLSRSKSDTEINYTVEISSESLASINYVTKGGELSFVVILKAIHSVTLRDSVCSIRICKITFNILSKLMDLKIIPRRIVSIFDVRKPRKYNANCENGELSMHHLFMDTLFRIIKQLGCSRGCGEGRRETEAIRLKENVMKVLKQLHEISAHHFEQYCEMLVTSHPIQEVIDIFHAFLGFCAESSSNSSTTTTHLTTFSSYKRPHNEFISKSGYSNNFGAALSTNTSAKVKMTVEAIIIRYVFTPFVTRLMFMQKELKVQENMSLYCEVRQFISYVRDHHGGVFRNTALYGLFASTKYMLQFESRQVNRSLKANFDTVSVQSSLPLTDSSEHHKTLSKKLNSIPLKPKMELERIQSASDFCDANSLGSNGFRGAYRSQSPFADDDVFLKNNKNFKMNPGQLLKNNHRIELNSTLPDYINMQHENSSLHSYLNITEPQSDRLIRRGSFSRQTLKNFSQTTMAMSMGQKSGFFKTKKRIDQFRNVFGKNKMKQGSFEDTPDMSRKNSLDFLAMHDESQDIPIRTSKTTPFQILKDGMLKFQFLLESCTPGTIPDAQLVAAMLDLKAPVLARAAFLIECSHFVHRCNRGQWPTWMRINFNFFRPSGPRSGSQTVVKSRASTTLQRFAGRCFYQWGELIASRLEDLLLDDIDCLVSNTSTSMTEEGGRRSKQSGQEDDDFLSVPCFGSKENNCPIALKIIACQLLHEITTFLRETHQYLPSKSSRRSSVVNSSPNPNPKESSRNSCIEPPPPKPAHHTNRRWSMALTNVGLRETSNAHSLISLANLGMHSERRISFVLHETEMENEGNSIGSSEDLILHDKKRLSQVGISNLLRRSTGSGHDSFKRRSIRLKKTDKKGVGKLRSATLIDDDYKTDLFKRSNSLRSRRKISGVSEKSDTSERFSGEESPGLMSDDGHSFESIIDTLDASDTEITTNIPWVKLASLFSGLLDFDCQHSSCSTTCHKKVIKSTSSLIKQVQQIYEKDLQPLFDLDLLNQKLIDDKDDAIRKEKKLKKLLLAQSSPLKRKSSAHNLDKYSEREGHVGSGSNQGLTHGTVDVEFGSYDCDDPRYIFNDVLSYRMEIMQEENHTMLYILNQVKNPFHSVISMMLKSALILNKDEFKCLLDLSWNLVLEEDIQISSTAAVGIILCSLKCPELVIDLLQKELNNTNVDVRGTAINKFLKIWCNRYQCWQRLEEGAQLVLKLPPPAIEFTVPSPRVALECKPVVDPPYMPIVKTKVDEVAINQEPSIQKSFVAATKTRRKQQIEMVTRALQEQEDKMREERENYRFNCIPLTLQASYEPALFHTIDDHDDNDDEIERIPLHHIQLAQCFFPSSLTTATLSIINLLEDTQVNSEGYAVNEIAYKVIWHCLTEEPALFLRNLLEKLTREKKMTVIQTLRRLVRFVPRLPEQAAFTLYNYLIGFIMHHVRTPYEDSHEIIASVMSIIWLIVPNVYGLFLKDLKQVLRKEQCDATILITANVPSAKKIIVHGPDASCIPSQFPVHEDTQFSQILTDSLDFFSIDEAKHNEYFLIDTKTNQIHNLNAFVRDFYFFKRSQYPQLSLVHMNPLQAYDKFQRQAFTLQFTELGKTLMSLSLIKTSFLGIQRVLFLHEELMKLPSFPRKALETNLTLYSGPMGKEVLGVDTLHKVAWVKMVARMFDATSGFFAESADIHLFLNVINGTLLLHCEDASILRLCMATYINAAHQFKNIFATNGYLLIVQTIVQIYANHQTNSLLCRTIEFVFKQFYILHRKPFVLQMFGAVAPLLDMDLSSSYSSTQIHPKAFFQLLQSLGQYTADPLDILELVEMEKPLKALDFCYQMDSEALTILDSISLCVTVISYAADSERGHQMLTVLDAILPFHLLHMQSLTTKKETPGGPRSELQMIHSISVCMKTLIYNCESLTRNFTGPQKSMDFREASIKNTSPQFEIDEDSHSKYNVDNYYSQKYNRTSEIDDAELNRLDYRKPRDLLLKIVSEFLTRSTNRLSDLSKKIPDLHQKNSSYELLDVKCHIRLAEIAHSLLKLAPYDPQTMACKGLVRYMNEILPNSEWRQEQMRPALIMVLRRLDKTFTKISKKTAIKRTTDWEAAKRLLKGVYLTFTKHPYIVHLPHLKSLINVCQNIILGDQALNLSDSSSSAFSTWTIALSQAPPPGFTSVAVRLISLQMIQLGESQSLETLCSSAFSSPEKSEIYLMNMIYPLCIRITSGMKDIPKLRQCDISFVLNIILNILKPITIKANTKGSDSSQAGIQLKQFSLQQIGFLGLKILITCFEKQLTTEWYRISKCIRDLADKPHLIGSTFWNFIDFASTYRTPLFVLLLPYIRCKYLAKTCDTEIERVYQIRIREKLNGASLPMNRSKGNLFVSLVTELKTLREDIIRRKNNPHIDERSRSIIQEPNSTGTSEKPETSGHRLSFAFSQLAASASKISNISSSNSNTAVTTASISTSTEPMLASQSTAKPRVLRGLSFRLGSDSRRLASRGLSVKLTSNQADKKMFARRTSYPDNPELVDNDCLKQSHSTHSEPKLYRRLTVHARNHKMKSPSSLSGEALCENHDSFAKKLDNSSSLKEDFIQTKHRMQRQKAQNRKSFRLMKSQKINEISEKSLIKSGSADTTDELKEQLNLLLKRESESSVTSPLESVSTTLNQGLLTSSQESRECDNDTNGNLSANSLLACDSLFDNKNALLFSSESQMNNNNNATNNNTEFQMQVINELGLSLNRRAAGDTANTLSSFESSLNALPFADEEV